MADHYEILGVAKNATADEIRKTYLALARERHPDRFTDPAEKAKAHELFQAATEAFNTLSNEARRKSYDQTAAQPKLQTPEELANDAYARALKCVESRQDQEAVDLLHAAIHHLPNEASYHAVLGRVLAKHPKHARDAVASMERAAALAPKQLAYHVELATLLHTQGLNIRARKALEAALKLAPANAAVVKLAGELGLLSEPQKPEPSKGPVAGLKGLFGKKG